MLANILNQNPGFHATGSSGLVDALTGIRNTCEVNPFFKAMPEDELLERKKGMFKGVMEGYFAGTDADVCFDKNRRWPGMLEMLVWVYGAENVKILCCMRDIRDVLASFEVLHRKTMASGVTSQTMNAPLRNMTSLMRAEYLCQSTEVVGVAKNWVVDAVGRGFRGNMFVVEYEGLCNEPEDCMRKIYGFLGDEYYDHDFDNVEQVTREDDRIHGFKGLHKIRKKVEPQEHRWPVVYDPATLNSPFWQQVTAEAVFWRG